MGRTLSHHPGGKHISTHTTPAPTPTTTPLCRRTVSKWPLVPILLAQFLSTYIFPVWLEKLVVTLFVLYLLSRTVIGFLNAIMEPEEGEGEGAEGAPAAEGAEGDAGHSHTEDMD
eukprot:TRINITY_DN7484_c0_g1_i1.p2 TRINITY_DN7484_c0_g1~~TRINITY_DN7484_c0_g1_i1.p2  ORF type:complete len:115 (+),score=22.22 TRINITY_DN7484_c0_g1_i1:483-827(+)